MNALRPLITRSLTGLLTTLLLMASAARATEEDAQKSIAEGQQQLDEMDFKKAEKSFAKALTQTKDNATKCKAYAGQAKAVLNQYKQKEAFELYMKVMGYLNPPSNPPKADDNKDAWAALEEAYILAERNMKDPKSVRRLCQKIIEIKNAPVDKVVEYNLRIIRSYDMENLPKEMNKALDKALAMANLEDKNKYRLLVSAGHMFLWNWEEGKVVDRKRARELFTQAQAVPNLTNSQTAELYLWIGDCYQGDGEYAAARAEYAKTLAVEKLGETSHLRYWAIKNTGWAFKREDNKSEAKKYFEQALAIADKAHNETWRKECDDGMKGL